MKSRIFLMPVGAMVAAVLLAQCAILVAAEKSSAPAADAGVPETVSSGSAAPVQLSSSAQEVLKLSHAKVGDDTITAFIENSGRSYSLSASEIIYLRAEGVSDRVVATMLDQQKKFATAAAPPASTAPAAPPVNNANATGTQSASQPLGVYAQPTATYVPPSTVYVIPDSAPAYYSYPYPYYGYYPAVSFSFGYGNCYRGGYYGGSGYCGSYYGGYRGGYYGGGYHGGGYHGGGHYGGGITAIHGGGGRHR